MFQVYDWDDNDTNGDFIGEVRAKLFNKRSFTFEHSSEMEENSARP